MVGEKAAWMAEGLLAGGAGDDQVMVFDQADDAFIGRGFRRGRLVQRQSPE